jgi:hypothetical protein
MTAPAAAGRCIACRYFAPEDGYSGDCRRYPPSSNAGAGRWPCVLAREFCGEFAARPAPAATPAPAAAQEPGA